MRSKYGKIERGEWKGSKKRAVGREEERKGCRKSERSVGNGERKWDLGSKGRGRG